MKNKILVTAATPYANGPLHFGHIAGAYLPADVAARFHRLIQDEVFYVCGSDEYGIAIALSAELAGRSPKEHVDIYHAVNQRFFRQCGISFDYFGRTTSPYHKEPVQRFFTELFENGFIEAKECEQLFSEEENRFLADRYVVGICPKCGYEEARGDECPKCGSAFEATELKSPKSKLTNSPLSTKKTRHWFLLLDKFKEKLGNWLSQKEWKPNVLNFIKVYVDEIRSRAITRDMEWGIPLPLPDTEGKVFYVWFDAPIGYISFMMEWDSERWKDWWFDPKTKLVQFMGKDNIPFHAAIFPAMIMGQNLPYKLVDELVANEFYNFEGKKFSKSEGWTIDFDRFFSKYSADQLRYMIAATAPETADSEFSWSEFQQKCNKDLVGKLGNFVQRTLSFLESHMEGKAPSPRRAPDEMFLLLDRVRQAYSEYKLRQVSQLLMEMCQFANGYFDGRKPWEYRKKEGKDKEIAKKEMEETIAFSLDMIKLLSIAMAPLMPESSHKLFCLFSAKTLDQIGWEEAKHLEIKEGIPLVKPPLLFRKIEDQEIAEEIAYLRQGIF